MVWKFKLGLPLSKPQVEDVIQYCSKAPFGLGLDTKYDDNVRKTWQMEPDRLRINNPNWDNSIQNLVQKEIRIGLDVGYNRKIKANLYKMLLYDEGSHFNFHKDIEKEPNMFGTLVVQLPSQFTGGNLCQRGCICKYFCFYADCEHCVLPIESGYRLCLIYNLVFSDSKEPPKTSLNVFNNELDAILTEWESQPSSLYYILDHDYSKLGLKFDCLKGRDAHVYNQLSSYIASHPKKLSLYLGILEQCNYFYQSDGYMKLNSKTFKLSSCVNMKNKYKCEISIIDPTCIIPKSRRNTFHTKTSKAGPQGNSSASAETIYHSACLIIFPNKVKEDLRLNFYPVLYLERLMKRNDLVKTREFYEMIVEKHLEEKHVNSLCNLIESYNNPSFASKLLEHKYLTLSQIKRLVSKFGVSALNLTKMKLPEETLEFLKYLFI